jgi:hypothetical protein
MGDKEPHRQRKVKNENGEKNVQPCIICVEWRAGARRRFCSESHVSVARSRAARAIAPYSYMINKRALAVSTLSWRCKKQARFEKQAHNEIFNSTSAVSTLRRKNGNYSPKSRAHFISWRALPHLLAAIQTSQKEHSISNLIKVLIGVSFSTIYKEICVLTE